MSTTSFSNALFVPTTDEMQRMVRDQVLEGQCNTPSVSPRELAALLLSQAHDLDRFVDLSQEQQETLEKLSEAPRPIATILAFESIARAPLAARIAFRGNQYAAIFHPDLDAESLRIGDQVIVTPDAGTILARCAHWVPMGGTMASFQRDLGGRQLELLLAGDNRIVVLATSALDISNLKPGDMIQFHEGEKIAYGVIPVDRQFKFGAPVAPEMTSPDVYPAFFERAYESIALPLQPGETGNDYLLPNNGSISLIGPPGLGKSTLVRLLIARLQQDFGDRVCSLFVSSADLYDPYFGVAEQRAKRLFEDAREAGQRGVCILVFDEGEGLTHQRGDVSNSHRDSTLSVLLSETGKADMGNVWIVILTNRPDQMDTAFKDRTRQMVFVFSHLTPAQARGMLACHLPEQCRFASNGKTPEALRAAMLDRAVELFFADTTLSHAVLNTGERRPVYPRDILSGRILRDTCLTARTLAAKRQLHGGDMGLRMADIEEAVFDSIDRMRRMNVNDVRDYLQHDLQRGMQIMDLHPAEHNAPQQNLSLHDYTALD